MTLTDIINYSTTNDSPSNPGKSTGRWLAGMSLPQRTLHGTEVEPGDDETPGLPPEGQPGWTRARPISASAS